MIGVQIENGSVKRSFIGAYRHVSGMRQIVEYGAIDSVEGERPLDRAWLVPVGDAFPDFDFAYFVVELRVLIDESIA